MLLISIAERLKDEKEVTARLLKNPTDIANIFANYYPANVAKSIETLLTDHLTIGAEIITSLRDGKSDEAQALTKKWYQNADEMATAFSGINPYYGKEELRKMLYMHLELTTKEVVTRLAGNYPADIQAFDAVEEEALKMADFFTRGIMQRFPRRFN